jgi:hypothetical protein
MQLGDLQHALATEDYEDLVLLSVRAQSMNQHVDQEAQRRKTRFASMDDTFRSPSPRRVRRSGEGARLRLLDVFQTWQKYQAMQAKTDIYFAELRQQSREWTAMYREDQLSLRVAAHNALNDPEYLRCKREWSAMRYEDWAEMEFELRDLA